MRNSLFRLFFSSSMFLFDWIYPLHMDLVEINMAEGRNARKKVNHQHYHLEQPTNQQPKYEAFYLSKIIFFLFHFSFYKIMSWIYFSTLFLFFLPQTNTLYGGVGERVSVFVYNRKKIILFLYFYQPFWIFYLENNSCMIWSTPTALLSFRSIDAIVEWEVMYIFTIKMLLMCCPGSYECWGWWLPIPLSWFFIDNMFASLITLDISM